MKYLNYLLSALVLVFLAAHWQDVAALFRWAATVKLR